jgi:protein-tyrosine phosphatase
MAEAIAREMLAQRGVDAEVVSAGQLESGIPATSGAIQCMSRRGIDLSTHLSHQLDVDTVRAADLILTMERRHLTSIAALDVAAVPRAFPVKELAELAPIVGRRAPDVSVQEWVRRAHAMRAPGSVLAATTDDDVADPMGGPGRAYRRTADELDELLRRIFDSLFPSGELGRG